MWKVPYNKMWPAGEKGVASKEIDGKRGVAVQWNGASILRNQR